MYLDVSSRDLHACVLYPIIENAIRYRDRYDMEVQQIPYALHVVARYHAMEAADDRYIYVYVCTINITVQKDSS